MEVLESIELSFINEKFLECPFMEEQTEAATEVEPEGVENDDRDGAQREQENNGGTLGENLIDGKPGAKGTVAGPFPPDSYLVKESASDSKPDRGSVHIKVIGTEEFDHDVYPFVMAAHHLIPGEAALAKCRLKKYMTKGETVKNANGRSWQIECHIGYNVNGAHNGIWLPGNYAIRTPSIPPKVWHKSPDVSKSWSDLGSNKWCMHYVASVAKKTGRQFHDAHTEYNNAVKKLLNKIATKLYAHQQSCDECKKKNNSKIAPPYIVKQRLYMLSAFLRRQLVGSPIQWKRPWYASDRWRNEVFSPKSGKINQSFLKIYNSNSE